MKTFVPLLSVAFLAGLLSVGMYAVDQQSAAAAANAFPPMVLPVAGPAVPASITPGAGPETISAPMARPASTAAPKRGTIPITELFARAREAYLKMDLRLAAAEIRKGAAALRSEESKATPDIRKDLAAAAMDLDRLALRIEQDKVKAGSELDTAFARVDQTLARHNMERGGGSIKPAAQYQSVAPHTDISATATRLGMPETAREPMSAAYAAPDKSAKSTGRSYEDLTRRVDALSKELAILQADLNRLKAREAGVKN